MNKKERESKFEPIINKIVRRLGMEHPFTIKFLDAIDRLVNEDKLWEELIDDSFFEWYDRFVDEKIEEELRKEVE